MTSAPSNLIWPLTSAPRGSSRSIARAVIDLPDPDSPTSPSASPGRTASDDITQHGPLRPFDPEPDGQAVDLEQCASLVGRFGAASLVTETLLLARRPRPFTSLTGRPAPARTAARRAR